MKQRIWGWKILKVLKIYKLNSILVKNFIITMLMMTLPLLIIVTFIRGHMNRIVEQEILDTNKQSLERTVETMDYVISQAFSFGYYLANDDALAMLDLLPYDKIEKEYHDFLDAEVQSYVKLQEYVESVYIYMEQKQYIMAYSRREGDSIMKLDEIEDGAWLEEYEKMEGKAYTIHARKKDNMFPYLMAVIISIQNSRGSLDGAIIVNINMKELGNVLGHTTKDKPIFFMLDQEKNLCYTNHVNLVDQSIKAPEYLNNLWEGNERTGFRGEIDGEQCIITWVAGDGGWIYVLCNPMTMYLNRMEDTSSMILILWLVSCGIGIVVSYVVTIHSYKPIQQIMNEVERSDYPDYLKEADLKGNYVDSEDEQNYRNELQYISEMVRNTRFRNKRLQMEAEEWMAKLNNAQMHALQSQINPHYLYNTLDVINWDAITQLGEGNSISSMLSSLAQFLRISLQRSSYLISIKEEIEHAKLYGKIVKGRYGESIQIHWKLDEEIMQYKIIRLSLQPLMENAVNHGLRINRYVGNIWISGCFMEEIIVISIEDDGIGMTSEQCCSMNQQLMNDYDSDSEHVGLRNVNQRMKIIFGDEYGINIMDREKGGLKVRLIFPKIM